MVDYERSEHHGLAYWVKRILLKSGELVTEHELRRDENYHQGVPPVVGDVIGVRCRGRHFKAKVIWGNWLGRDGPTDMPVLLRVEEI
jgi:hypothetical protein